MDGNGADTVNMSTAANAEIAGRDRWILDISGSLLYVRGVNSGSCRLAP